MPRPAVIYRIHILDWQFNHYSESVPHFARVVRDDRTEPPGAKHSRSVQDSFTRPRCSPFISVASWTIDGAALIWRMFSTGPMVCARSSSCVSDEPLAHAAWDGSCARSGDAPVHPPHTADCTHVFVECYRTARPGSPDLGQLAHLSVGRCAFACDAPRGVMMALRTLYTMHARRPAMGRRYITIVSRQAHSTALSHRSALNSTTEGKYIAELRQARQD